LTRPKAILAGWVLPMGSEAIENGGVVWTGDRILAVGSRHRVMSLSPQIKADAARSILLPGLINAHAHLELTGLSNRRPAARRPFTSWLDSIVMEKRRLTGAVIRRAILAGERRLLETGTTAVADIASTDAALSFHRTLRTRVFQEVLGVRSAVRLPRRGRPLSPHAPYSLSDENLRRVSRWWFHHPESHLTMHIGESASESDYFLRGTGPFRDFYSRLGLNRPAPGERVIGYLDSLHLLRYGLLAVHLNDVTSREARLLAKREIACAVCPGSMSFFGFSPAGVRRQQSAGMRLVFGTDSLASNTDLNLFRELRLARRILGWSARRLLCSATVLAGQTLWDGNAGELKPGACADFLLVRRAGGRTADPYEDLMRGKSETRIERVWSKGETALRQES